MKSPKDVLALGRVIVSQLELASRGAVLERWLSHHLAEVLDEADRATGKAKADAERNAVRLILKLWLHRRALPEPADPLGGYRKAIEVLGSLTPESNPWQQSAQSGEDVELLRDTFDSLAKVVVFGLSLTHVSGPRAVTLEEIAALSTEEVEIKEMLDKWLPFASRPNPSIRFEFVENSEGGISPKATGEGLESAKKDVSSSERLAGNDETALRTNIIEEIKHTQQALGKLLSRWKSEAENTEG